MRFHCWSQIFLFVLCSLFQYLTVFQFFYNFQMTFFWLVWTISSNRKGQMIRYGTFFKAHILGHMSCPLAGLLVPFRVIWGVSKWPKNSQK